MSKPSHSTRLHQAFLISIILKAIDAVFETIGGTILLIVSPAAINGLAQALTRDELSENPHDFIANHILHTAGSLTRTTTVFVALYLLGHGLAKLVLIIAVLRRQLWAYPWMIGLIGLFMIYQIYRIGLQPTLGLTLLTIFDAVVVWLTWQEYKSQKALKV